MISRRSLSVAVAATLTTVLCARNLQAEDNPTEVVRRTIDEGNSKYIEACAKLDPVAFAAIYDKDGARLERGGEIVRGRNLIAKKTEMLWSKLAPPLSVATTTRDIWVVDSLAYESGSYSISAHPKTGGVQQISGHYLTIWKRQATGGWKIFRDMNVWQAPP
jgi:ketosteroid isomerase-like protein